MDSILVVNAGSSSVKFEVFTVDGSTKLTRKIKGQIDGIGTRPRLRTRRATEQRDELTALHHSDHYHLVGAREQRRRDFEAKRSRHLEVPSARR
jgi:acetate kinase